MPATSASASRPPRRASCTSAASAPRSTTGSSPATHGGVAVLRIEDTDVGARDRRRDRADPALAGLGRPRLRRVAGAAAGLRALPPERAARALPRGRRRPAGTTGWPTATTDRRRRSRRRRAAARETDDPASATRAHRDLTRAQIAEFEAAGRLPAIRFRVADRGRDGDRGPRARRGALGAPAARRPRPHARRRLPTYQLANPVDDLDHRITHVIRGEDLLPSTPRQRLLVEALGGTYPQHGPPGDDARAGRSGCRKRHGAA